MDTDSFEIHTPDFDPTNWWHYTVKERRFQNWVQFIHRPGTAFAQSCSTFEKLGNTISLQETGIIATVICHKSPFLTPICIQTTHWPENNHPHLTSLFPWRSHSSKHLLYMMSHLGKKVHSSEAKRIRLVKWWQYQRKYYVPYILYPWPSQN